MEKLKKIWSWILSHKIWTLIIIFAILFGSVGYKSDTVSVSLFGRDTKGEAIALLPVYTEAANIYGFLSAINCTATERNLVSVFGVAVGKAKKNIISVIGISIGKASEKIVSFIGISIGDAGEDILSGFGVSIGKAKKDIYSGVGIAVGKADNKIESLLGLAVGNSIRLKGLVAVRADPWPDCVSIFWIPIKK